MNYPISLDNDANLYLVHDGLRMQLAADYTPGATSITVQGDPVIFSRFPASGLLTLTEQCSDIDKRALSFSYTSKGTNVFNGLKLLSCFKDYPKPKGVTDVTRNVMAVDHNVIKDAAIAVQTFVGIKNDIATKPLTGTVEARTNYLRNLVLHPKAWFNTSTIAVGVVPLCVNFIDLSTRHPSSWLWNFGDGTTSSISGTVGDVSKCYLTPGVYNVTLTVTNSFGSDSTVISKAVTARQVSPNVATISFVPQSIQSVTNGVMKSRTNLLVTAMVLSSGVQVSDPISSWTWNMSDDLPHDHSSTVKAAYSIGGVYDIVLRADTTLGAYRNTVFSSVVNIVEKFNLWHFIFSAAGSGSTQNLFVYELGLLSETYKTASPAPATSVTRNAGFLSSALETVQQTREFLRNNGFSPQNFTASGDDGNSLIWWAEGGASSDSQNVRFRQLSPFSGVWTTPTMGTGNDAMTRGWNWISLSSASKVYFLLGTSSGINSPTNQVMNTVSLQDYSIASTTFTSANYVNNASELMNNVGSGTDGNFSVYRSTWAGSTGYIVRNDGVGSFFRLKSFYITQGSVSSPLQNITKLTDMPGTTKFEGQMVALTNGVYFFNNSGEVAVYNSTSNVWQTGGPGVNSPVFANLQDSTVVGYDSPNNTLVATGDGDHTAYLSYDYSTKAVIKFNETNLTFSALPTRPAGEQFLMSVY